MSNENTVRNLIRVDDKTNPAMARALQLLLEDVYKVYNILLPPTSSSTTDTGGTSTLVGTVQNYTGVAFPTNLRLQWDDLDGAFRYEIRLGSDWDTATRVITTASNTVNLDPVQLNLVTGTYTFLLKPINLSGDYGELSSIDLVVSTINPPDLDLDIVSNSVILRWTAPASTWKVDHYIIYRNSVEIGTLSGTFKLIQEQVGGSYSYSVAAVDIVGNIGTTSAVRVADLHDPSEFEFVDSLAADFTGTYVKTDDVIIDGITGIIGPVNVESWADHFANNSNATFADFIADTFDLFFQPSYNGAGTYEEVFDFGSVLTDLTIVVNYSKLQITGSTTITTTISYSNDNITYSTPVVSSNVFGTSFRYVKVKWTFTNTDNLSAAFISNLLVILNVTLTIDSGTADVLASDSGGTEIFYNKTYIGINSVTATAAVSTQPLYAVVDAADETSFKVLVFDSSGNRADATISWKSRGII